MKRKFAFIILQFSLWIGLATQAQNVGIGTNRPDSSAQLDISSTNRGLLPPRMTYAQRNAIINPSQGLMVYCTNCTSKGEMQYYDGTQWIRMSSGSASEPIVENPDDTSFVDTTMIAYINTNNNFTILKFAIQRAGIANLLSTGNLTFFAPDNAAFVASGIDSAAIISLTPQDLTEFLTYHIIPYNVASIGLPSSDTVNTLLGRNLYLSKNANGSFVNGIKIKMPNIQLNNGVVHILSNVISYPTQSIAEIISSDPDFSTLLAALVKVSLVNIFNNNGKYTFFAPTNNAFEAVGLIPSVINDPSTPVSAVATILKSHVIGTNVFASDLTQGSIASTLQSGVSLIIGTNPPSIKISGSSNYPSNITSANIIATNGVIHVIDNVMLP